MPSASWKGPATKSSRARHHRSHRRRRRNRGFTLTTLPTLGPIQTVVEAAAAWPGKMVPPTRKIIRKLHEFVEVAGEVPSDHAKPGALRAHTHSMQDMPGPEPSSSERAGPTNPVKLVPRSHDATPPLAGAAHPTPTDMSLSSRAPSLACCRVSHPTDCLGIFRP